MAIATLRGPVKIITNRWFGLRCARRTAKTVIIFLLWRPQ